MSRRSRKVAELRQREEGFSLGFCTDKAAPSALSEYNALHDVNMRHYFENPVVQKHLYRTGQIDRAGRVIDLDKNKSKLHIIEQEFRSAQQQEETRLQEEEEMRMRVQQKRYAALEKARLDESLQKMKEDKALRREIMNAYQESRGVTRTLTRGTPHNSTKSLKSSSRSKKKGMSGSRSRSSQGNQSNGIFVTEMAGTGVDFDYTHQTASSDTLDQFVHSR
mmetsp:Transcript_3316/g.4665  ORF Transcript_3316/g.4665 Transcript_3316/m.4665 type:complete len:221 (-) Transcript_3316:152-814(-)|eukprot:CAMPEP_0117764540 /NCGR_PEP_ID=MMETSP0947-20121206/19446_1 /TAXON_ID=44440 /ORGANISM="Chattonella subsalsa, Strain CCMP2191" /LENGTH=220 /DNA_ID=CAMNT_0005586761 /DNA_START=22 /DNA_END=684 /DNA_ORIENTATION=-